MKRIACGAFIATVWFFEGCGSSSVAVNGAWNTIASPQAVVIDGSVLEWPAKGWKEEKDVRFNIVNDSAFVYVAVVIVKPEVRRQVAMQGMTVWFDPNGREKKSFGVRYPLGGFGGRVFSRGGATEFPPESSGDETRERNAERGASEFEYLSPYEPNRERVPLLFAEGVEIKFDNWGDSLVYELKLPMHPSPTHHYTAEAAPGMKIAVGIDVSFERPEGSNTASGGRMPDGGRGGGRGGGMGGRSGGRGGFGGGGRGGGGQNSARPLSPIEIWAAVQLAAGPAK